MQTLILVLVVIGTALAFDFTNGFHDTGNAMATSIATGALKPKVAVTSLRCEPGRRIPLGEVAKTVSKRGENPGRKGARSVHGHDLIMIVFAGLVGGILWNLLTWLFGLPSSSSHALFGGLIGAAVASLGLGVNWAGTASWTA